MLIIDEPNVQELRYWVKERESIRKKRARGIPAPWTKDPILATYRFCNVRRKDDRVSQWVIRSIVEPYAKHPNLPFMLALARYVNWPDTLQEIMDARLWPTTKPDWRGIGDLIDARRRRGEQTWTGAYMIRAESSPRAAWYSWPKSQYICQIVLGRELWENRDTIRAAVRSNSVETATTAIAGRYGWGSFMAGQVTADLTYCAVLGKANDLYSWAPLGPGSQRGLNRLAGRPLKTEIKPRQAVEEMRALRKTIIATLGREFSGLTLHDVQNCLCEVDKFLRTKNGEGKPRSRFVADRAAIAEAA